VAPPVGKMPETLPPLRVAKPAIPDLFLARDWLAVLGFTAVLCGRMAESSGTWGREKLNRGRAEGETKVNGGR